MKILILSGAFYPENSPRSFRSTELVKEFCRQGHDVTYIGRYDKRHHDKLINEFGFTFIDAGSSKWQVLPSVKFSFLNNIFRITNRVINLLFEYPDIQWTWDVQKVLKKIGHYDLMISIAVPHPIHWGVYLAKRLGHNKADVWIGDCGDSYYLNTLVNYRPPFYFKYIESAWCNSVDFISNPMDAMKENFLPPFRHKCVEIPQGFKIEDSEKYLKPYFPNIIPTFAFSGSFIPGSRDPRPFLEYLVSKDWDFTFHVFTRLNKFVEPFMKKANGRIILHEYIPREELLAFHSQMDFLVNFTFNPAIQVPSKLIDYLITGKPILNIEPKLDTTLVDDFMEGNYTSRFNALSLDRYRIENVCAKFLELAISKKSLSNSPVL
ncbi:MAG: hypothetical protein IPM42_10275 [Saprospiraceae bacterium]|nr:hypothetical protein [Saprospiraceae bacterium]